MKPAGCTNGLLSALVIHRSATSVVDAEVELAIVIARDRKTVDVTSAANYILGYTTANDITCRDVQGQMYQRGHCKDYDEFCPLGPSLVSAEHLPRPLQLRMTTTIDGTVIQNGTTTDMIFSPAEIVLYISRVSFSEYVSQCLYPLIKDTTLARGAVMLTGTSAGIGHSHRPPRYLSPGCDLKFGIERIGTSVNYVIADGATTPRL